MESGTSQYPTRKAMREARERATSSSLRRVQNSSRQLHLPAFLPPKLTDRIQVNHQRKRGAGFQLGLGALLLCLLSTFFVFNDLGVTLAAWRHQGEFQGGTITSGDLHLDAETTTTEGAPLMDFYLVSDEPPAEPILNLDFANDLHGFSGYNATLTRTVDPLDPSNWVARTDQSNNWEGINIPVNGATPGVSFTPGARYNVSVRVLAWAQTAGATARIWTQAAGPSWPPPLATATISTDQWTTLNFTGVMPANLDFLRITVASASGANVAGSFFIDDLVITPYVETPDNNGAPVLDPDNQLTASNGNPRLRPGDIVAGTADISIGLEGENLAAELALSSAINWTGWENQRLYFAPIDSAGNVTSDFTEIQITGGNLISRFVPLGDEGPERIRVIVTAQIAPRAVAGVRTFPNITFVLSQTRTGDGFRTPATA